MYTLYIDRNRILTLFSRIPDINPIFPRFPDFQFYGDFGPKKSGKSDKFWKNRKIYDSISP